KSHEVAAEDPPMPTDGLERGDAPFFNPPNDRHGGHTADAGSIVGAVDVVFAATHQTCAPRANSHSYNTTEFARSRRIGYTRDDGRCPPILHRRRLLRPPLSREPGGHRPRRRR